MDSGDHPIVFFDGYCGLCNEWVDFLVKRDKSQVFRYSPLQGETAKAHFGSKGEDELMRSVWLLDSDGLHNRSTAVLRMLRRLPWPWKALGALVVVPRPVRDWAYATVARNRFRIKPRMESCRVPSPAERSLFLP